MKIHLLIVVMLVFTSLFVLIPLEKQSVSAIDLTGWQYIKKITIDHTKVYADLINFPILFDNTSADFHAAQADGDDFMFLNNGNTTKYNHEIELFSSNRLIAWVNITSLSDSVDTVVWLYYGNTVCASQQSVSGTWNSNYVMVQHMNGSSWGALDDATSNNNDVTGVTGTPLYQKPGMVGYSTNFTATAYLSFANSVRETFPMTVEIWLRPTKYNAGNYLMDTGCTTAKGGFAIDLDSVNGNYMAWFKDDASNKGRERVSTVHPK